MPTQISIGFSEDIDPFIAARDAAFEARTKLKNQKTHFALVFATIHYKPSQILPIINETLEEARLIGSSCAGIILSNANSKRGLAILAIHSNEIQFGIGSVENINPNDTYDAGRNLARMALSDFTSTHRYAFLTFIDGRIANNSPLLKGVQEVLGNAFPIIGAGSCDDFHFNETYQFFQNNALQHSAIGVILGGQIAVGIGGGHGWRPLGKPRLIDKTEGNIIETIDGKYAAAIYDEYLGSESQHLHSDKFGQMGILYPLGIYVEESNQYLLRNAVDILPNGNIVCQGDVQEKSIVHVMIGNKESCKDAAIQAAREASRNLLGKTAKLVIIIESMARLKLLGRMAFEEIKEIKEIFGSEVSIFGMYSHGEIYPVQTKDNVKKPHHQNESIAVLAIS